MWVYLSSISIEQWWGEKIDSVQNLFLNKNTNIHKQNILVDDLAANSTGI